MSSAKPRGSKGDKEREKLAQDRLQMLLTRMLKDEDNKYCVDCDSKGPRWASWNLGLFLCIRCAGIHRNLGVHISKVKSVNLDSWTPIQVSSMQLMGNSRARAVYEANLPDGFVRPQNDQALEQFIRAKYEKKKYMAKEYVAQKPPEFPEGWDELVEAEKQKKDLKKIILPSHTHKKTTGDCPAQIASDTTARPKAAAAAAAAADKSVASKPAAAAKATPAAPASSSSAAMDLLGLGIGNHDHADGAGLGSGSHDILGLGNNNSGFGSMVSAGPATANHDATASSAAAANPADDHDGFFNATSSIPTKQAEDSSKMSKDSIMALFGKSGSSASLSNGSMFGAGGANGAPPMNNGSMFGASNAAPTNNGGAMFGAASSTMNNMFGGTASVPSPSSLSNGAMFGANSAPISNGAMFGALSSQQPTMTNGSMGMFGAKNPTLPQQSNMFMQNMNGTTGASASPFGAPAQSGFGMNPQSNPFLTTGSPAGNSFAGGQSFMKPQQQQGTLQTNQQMQNQFGGLNLGTNTFSGMLPAAGNSNSWTMGPTTGAVPSPTVTSAASQSGAQASNLLGLW